MSTVKVHADFLVTSEELDQIHRIMKSKSISKPEVMRRALNLYFAAIDASEKQLEIGFYNQAGSVKRKVIGL